jgi:Nidogen-like
MSIDRIRRAILAAALCASATISAAFPLVNNLGGPRGYGTESVPRNDDQFSNAIPLPFTVNFFGRSFASIFVNNNGSITFNDGVSQYTPAPFPISAQPMIAPFWADVDTRPDPGDGSNLPYINSPNQDTVVVTWDQVGYYNSKTDKKNDFQMLLIKVGTAGDFDVEFRYNQLQWTTGDASGGSGGLGGTPGQAGYDAGDGTNFLTLPGSRTADVLKLQATSNVAADKPGLWRFAIRNGQVPGTEPANPLLPTANDPNAPLPNTLPPDNLPPGAIPVQVPGYNFFFNIALARRIFIDPDIAIGYDYIANSGPKFKTVTLPKVGTDEAFDLYLWDGTKWIFSRALGANLEHDFGVDGVERFRILGIDTTANLDPTNTQAFVTGLTFATAGDVNMNQNPIVIKVQTAGTPPPPAASSGGGGGGGCVASSGNRFDPTLWAAVLIAFAAITRRYRLAKRLDK